MTRKIPIILRPPFLLFFFLKQVATKLNKINQHVFEFHFKVRLSRYCLIIWDGKNHQVLLSQWQIDLILLIIPHLCSYFMILLIAENYLLGICCTSKESFRGKLALKSMLSLCLNLKLLRLKLKRPVNVPTPTSWCSNNKSK